MGLETAKVLKQAANGDGRAADQLMPLVYDELHGLAEHLLRGGRGEPTLQPTALIHEAYLKLIGAAELNWRSRTHFFAIAARAMRQVLHDHVRGRRRAKRGGGWTRITLSGTGEKASQRADPGPDVAVDVLNDALARLHERDERAASVVVMRFLGGLRTEEIAEVLGVTPRTVRNDWDMARAWLHCELADRAGGGVP